MYMYIYRYMHCKICMLPHIPKPSLMATVEDEVREC